MSQTTGLNLEVAVDAFETVTKNKPNPQDRISQRTVNSYRRNIRYFIEWLADERGKGPLEADSDDLEVYLTQRKAGSIDGGEGDKDKTIVTRRSAISRFYDELPSLASKGYLDIDSEDCPENPEEGYDGTWTVQKSYKEQQSGGEISYLDPGEVKQLWQNVPTPVDRNRLIVRMLYQTGMRVSELINIKRDNLHRDSYTITVPASISKSDGRTVAYKSTLDDDLRLWLDGGLRDAVPGANESDYFFPTVESERISRESVRRIVREAAKSADLNRDIYTDKSGNTRTKVSPHILRHSMAVNTLKAGTMNVRELQEFLGHTELETTEVYLRIASDDAVDAYKDKGGPPEGE